MLVFPKNAEKNASSFEKGLFAGPAFPGSNRFLVAKYLPLRTCRCMSNVTKRESIWEGVRGSEEENGRSYPPFLDIKK